MRMRLAFLFLCLAPLCAGCGDEDGGPAPAADKAIVAFSFPGPGVPGEIDEDTHLIGATVTFGTDVSELAPLIEHTGISIDPASGEAQDFRRPVVYTVTAADGTTQAYVAYVSNGAAVTTAAIAGNTAYTIHLTGTAAVGGGNVTSQGLSPVTARGLCWNTTGNPTLADSSAAAGSGTGAFTNVAMPGLLPRTTYYVRAYATNAEGTAYGSVMTFDSGRAFGDDYAGGWVFYNDGMGGGLTCGKADIYNGPWSNVTGVAFGGTSGAIGAGLANSLAIVAQAGHTSSAAKACLDYTDGTYDDWFQPSSQELLMLHTHLRVPGVGNIGPYTFFWSSTENGTEALYLANNGIIYSLWKTAYYTARPVRVF